MATIRAKSSHILLVIAVAELAWRKETGRFPCGAERDITGVSGRKKTHSDNQREAAPYLSSFRTHTV